MKDRSHDKAMVEYFHAIPSYAAELLAEVRLDGDPAELAILLRQTAEAFGQDGLRVVSQTRKERE
ncbi:MULTISPECIES: transcriptional regulator [Gammaproteobacteria]|uniref:Transcriptional regulator n=1 Tax=Serratia grimesii TaxID=82995 RepID=A0A9C7V6V3_9GAMM|nr:MULTISPECIES: transcriptional regulator [Gammaproteobacteria]EEW1935096.1 transcriptional regulator [Escherichia coli]EKN3438170.1 hypothetical protein [Yersinia enterocolitica]CAF2800309.1 hypothetical protein AI2937V1_1361 [Klebsiella oxytoca]EFB4638672.1 transcriptional regulator [Escherichia coli]EFD0339110.1 transcriptional regulator [Escherichia coli]